MANNDAKWIEYGKQHLEGRRIVKVRYMWPGEAGNLGWSERAIVLCLDDGTVVYPSADDEGNGAGALFGFSGGNGEDLTFPVLR